MRRKVILGSAAVLAIGVSVVIFAAISSSHRNAAPPQNSIRSNTNEASSNSLSSGKVSEVTEKKPGAGPSPQQAAQPLTASSPMPSQTISDSQPTTDKFSGTWVLDPARSEGLDLSMKQTMVVTRSGNVLNVKTTISTAQRGEWTVTDSYTLNESETEFTEQSSGGAEVNGLRIARLTDSGNGIEVSERATMVGQGVAANVNTTRRWALADDKTLIIEMNITGPNINRHHKRFFIKQ